MNPTPRTKKLFLVKNGNVNFITYQWHREAAKQAAQPILSGNPDNYLVTPLTEDGDKIAFDYITIAS